MKLNHYIKFAERNELLNLLCRAKISVGHLNGRRIEVASYQGQITFTEMADQIEEYYQAATAEMRLRQQRYHNFINGNTNELLHSLDSALISVITYPLALLADTIRWAATQHPQMSIEEEKRIVSVLEWRKNVDEKLNDLFESSQQDLDQYAKTSWIGPIVQTWDRFLNWNSNWRNTHTLDEAIFKAQVRSRPV